MIWCQSPGRGSQKHHTQDTAILLQQLTAGLGSLPQVTAHLGGALERDGGI